MKLFIEYESLILDISNKMMLVPLLFWCPENVKYIIVRKVSNDTKSEDVKMTVILVDGTESTCIESVNVDYYYAYNNKAFVDDRITEVASNFRNYVNNISTKAERKEAMGKAIKNAEGLVKLCDYMDAWTKEIAKEYLQLKRFEDNNAIIRLFDTEVSVSLDDIDNWSYNAFKFNMAEVYSATANKESKH